MQTGIKFAGRNISNLRYTDDTTLMAENEEELKSLFRVLRCVLDKSRSLEEISSRNMDSKGAPGEASYGNALLETGRKAILL